MRKNDTKNGFVYIFTDGHDRVKIGVTADVVGRYNNLKIANPSINLFGKIPSKCYALEKFLHNSLKDHNIGGEWFAPESDVILKIFNLISESGHLYDALYVVTGNALRNSLI